MLCCREKILLSPYTVVNIDRSLTGTNLSLNLFFGGRGRGVVAIKVLLPKN